MVQLGDLCSTDFSLTLSQRRLPWESTLQLSLTLAMVNPFLWYLVDRSRAGFMLSGSVGLAGAAVLMSINPAIVPAPAVVGKGRTNSRTQGNISSGADVTGGVLSLENIGAATWIASVLFCSCVCFGALGRRLALEMR